METYLNTSLVGSLLSTLSSTFSASFSGFSMSDIPEDQIHTDNYMLANHVQSENEYCGTGDDLELSNMADMYPKFLRVKHNKYSITVHIDPQKFEFVKHILDSEPCMTSCSASVQNGTIYRIQEKNTVTATLYKTTSVLHIQGLNCFRWLDHIICKCRQDENTHAKGSYMLTSTPVGRCRTKHDTAPMT